MSMRKCIPELGQTDSTHITSAINWVSWAQNCGHLSKQKSVNDTYIEDKMFNETSGVLLSFETEKLKLGLIFKNLQMWTFK